MVVGHLVPLAISCGLGASLPALMLSLYAVVNGLGRVLFGFLFDKFGFRVSLAADAALMTAGLMILNSCTGSAEWTTFAMGITAVGLAYGGCFSQLGALCMSLYGSRHFGAIYGFSSTQSMMGSFLGPFVAGCLFSIFGTYASSLTAACILSAVSFVALYVLVRNADVAPRDL